MASPRERAASIATARFSLTFLCPMNSPSRCGRSFNSKEESSSTGAAETSRSRSCGILGVFLTVATGAIVPASGCRMPDGTIHKSRGRGFRSAGNPALNSLPCPTMARETLLGSRQEILRTAGRLFQQHGYDATSMNDVAAALKLSKGGLYHHFQSKDEILFEIMNHA